MNVQRIPEYLLRWAVTILGIALAIFLVKGAGSGSYGKIALVGAAAVSLTLLFTFRENIWVLVPICWDMQGSLPSLEIPFIFKDLAVMGIFASMVTFRAFKVVTRRAPWTVENTIAAVMLLYMATVWIRNPVGVAAINSDRVGGRPYFNILIAMLACWVVSQCSVSGKRSVILLIAIAIGEMFDGILSQLIFWFPAIWPFFQSNYTVGAFFWALDPDTASAAVPAGEGAQRLGYLSGIGTPLTYLLFSFCGPFQLLDPRRFVRLALFGLAMICVLLSGFRSAFVAVMVAAILAAYYWGGRAGIIKTLAGAVVALTLLILGNGLLFELPFSAQRALSFLPGKWDQTAVVAAKESTRWRVEMWEAMLKSNRYIENKTLGDGFGFRKRDLELMIYFAQHGDESQGQESFLISGNVHSGPVSAIRYAGYVGLAIFMTLQIDLARRGWRLMFKARYTPLRNLAFFIGLRTLLGPFIFVLVYGAFENAIPEALFDLGLLHMLQNSLDDEERRAAEKVSAAIPAMSTARQPLLPAHS